jgi:hypothetical protein
MRYPVHSQQPVSGSISTRLSSRSISLFMEKILPQSAAKVTLQRWVSPAQADVLLDAGSPANPSGSGFACVLGRCIGAGGRKASRSLAISVLTPRPTGEGSFGPGLGSPPYGGAGSALTPGGARRGGELGRSRRESPFGRPENSSGRGRSPRYGSDRQERSTPLLHRSATARYRIALAGSQGRFWRSGQGSVAAKLMASPTADAPPRPPSPARRWSAAPPCGRGRDRVSPRPGTHRRRRPRSSAVPPASRRANSAGP